MTISARATFACGVVLLGAAAALAAEPVPIVTRAARTDVALTVYNEDLALVKDTRDVTLPAGESALRFEDVAAKIDPRTVAVRSVTTPERLAVVEQNYVFDLISPEKLMEKYVGQEVELVETDEKLESRTTKATLLGTNGGPVYRVGDRIAVGHPGRVILPRLPEELYARPTLLWRLASGGAGKQTVEVSYLTGGLAWAADYVLVVGADDARGDLTGWVTLTNQSGARYDEATLKLVAGQVNRTRPPEMVMEAMGAPRAKAAPRFAEEAFFEYHLYTLDRRATVAENETKQMRLLSASGVGLTKRFLVAGQPLWYRSRMGELGRNVPVGVFLELQNADANHLGMPLPAGTVRLYKQDKGGAQQFIGEDRITHTPKDEKVTLKAGDAFDVVATRTQTDYRTIDLKPYDAEVAFEVRLRNHKREPVTVTLREPIGGEWKVVESTHPAVKVDARTLGFEVPVSADGEVAVRYRAQIAY
ncbi:MAG: DUF4139 domain-containing protein [Candidatus Binatia bacterium]